MSDGSRWMRVVFAGVLVCAGQAALAAYPVVSNVRAAQRAGTGLFDISYDLADAATTNLTVTVAISTNNGADWFAPAASNLTGAVGNYSVSPGTGKALVWQGGRELPPRLLPSVKVRITADDTPSPLSYLVINLSGGMGAANYPVTYYASNAVPGGANSDAYKTTNLLMRLIPKGSFTMGSPADELGRNVEEMKHTVTLTMDFYIGVFEVTQRQWELVMGNKPSYFNNATYYASRPVEQVSYFEIRENPANSYDPAVDWPANSVVNAASFMGKLRAKTGLATFDLPTESQWEYACRAGTTTALNSGKNLNSTTTDANMAEVGRYLRNGGSGYTQDGDTSGGTAKVGTYRANAWGLYDMHGNAWEWCLDWYGTYPDTVSDPAGAGGGFYRVARGGDWYEFASSCRSAFRNRGTSDAWSNHTGFRAARTLPLMAGSVSDISSSTGYDLSPSYLAVGLSVTPVGNTNAVQVVVDNSGDGGSSVKLGGVGLLADGQMAGIEWSVTGSGVLSFDWKVSSEVNWDVLRFYEVGGAVTNKISGTPGGWSRVYTAINSAPDTVHTFRWEYAKDPAGDYVGQDCGWVDATSWSPFYGLIVNNGSGDGAAYTNGTVVTITADAPPTYFTFDRWTGDTNTVANVFASTTTLRMPVGGATVTAMYKAILYSLTVGNGSGDGAYTNGASIKITADAPPLHFTFDRWTGNATGVLDVYAPSTTLVMLGSETVVTATYKAILYPITVNRGIGSGAYTNGAAVTITADAPPADQKFDRWVGDANSVANILTSPTILSMPATSVTVTATYVSMLHSLTVINGFGGGVRREGSTVSISADPDPLWKEFAVWTGDGAGLLGDAAARTTSLTMPMTPTTLTATYRDSVARVAGCYGRTFTISGNAGGVTTDLDASSPSGTPAIKLGGAGVLPDNGFALFETVVSGSGTVTFWWKVSSEIDADYLEFRVDGVLIAAISGTKGPWAQVTNRVEGAGVKHTLHWEYVKNGSLASSTDAGWVDDIVWKGDVPEPVITPDIHAVTATDGFFGIGFMGERGMPYTVYSNATLEASGWSPMAVVPQEQGETNGVFRFLATVVPESGQKACFYRMGLK